MLLLMVELELSCLSRVELLDPAAVLDHLLGYAYDATKNALVIFN